MKAQSIGVALDAGRTVTFKSPTATLVHGKPFTCRKCGKSLDGVISTESPEADWLCSRDKKEARQAKEVKPSTVTTNPQEKKEHATMPTTTTSKTVHSGKRTMKQSTHKKAAPKKVEKSDVILHRGRPLRFVSKETVIAKLEKVEPNPVHNYSIKIGGKDYPVRQVAQALTGFDAGTFGSWESYVWCKVAGFSVKGDLSEGLKEFARARARS